MSFLWISRVVEGAKPNAPRNDWGILVVEFLVRPYLGFLMFAFDWRLGLLGWGGRMGLNGGGLVVVVRVVQIHDANRNKKIISASTNRTAKGDF